MRKRIEGKSKKSIDSDFILFDPISPDDMALLPVFSGADIGPDGMIRVGSQKPRFIGLRLKRLIGKSKIGGL